MRIFSILVLLISMIIDVRIALPYALFLFGSGMLVDAARGVVAAYSLSAFLELIAIILLIMNKQGKLLFAIAVAVIGIVILNYIHQPDAGRNFIAVAGAITIFGAMFSSAIERLNPEESQSDIRKAQFLYAVLPTVLLLLAPFVIFHEEITSAYKKQQARNAHAERERIDSARQRRELERKQSEYSERHLERYKSSATGYIKGEVNTLQIKDSLTVYNPADNELTIYLFPTSASWEEKKAILGGRPPFFVLSNKKSPNIEQWPNYPYARVKMKFGNSGAFSVDNVEDFSIMSHNLDKGSHTKTISISYNIDKLIASLAKEYKPDGVERLSLQVNTDGAGDGNIRMPASVLDIDDKIHSY